MLSRGGGGGISDSAERRDPGRWKCRGEGVECTVHGADGLRRQWGARGVHVEPLAHASTRTSRDTLLLWLRQRECGFPTVLPPEPSPPTSVGVAPPEAPPSRHPDGRRWPVGRRGRSRRQGRGVGWPSLWVRRRGGCGDSAPQPPRPRGRPCPPTTAPPMGWPSTTPCLASGGLRSELPPSMRLH